MLADEKILFRKIFKRALLPSFTSCLHYTVATLNERSRKYKQEIFLNVTDRSTPPSLTILE